MQAHFGFLVFDQFEEMDLVGPYEMIGIWGHQFNGPDLISIISEHAGTVKGVNGLTIQPDCTITTCEPLDYLLVPGGMGTRAEVGNANLITFIRERAKECKQVLSVCTGAFMLQAAGLLKQKMATTHWASMDRLRAFTEVDVVEKRFTHDGDIWTSAGISAGTDMALAFIADIAGEQTAGQVQKQAEYYPLDKVYAAE